MKDLRWCDTHDGYWGGKGTDKCSVCFEKKEGVMKKEDLWIRTIQEPHWYISKIHGVVYLSWVTKKDREDYACSFPIFNIDKWLELMEDMSGLKLEALHRNPQIASVYIREGRIDGTIQI